MLILWNTRDHIGYCRDLLQEKPPAWVQGHYPGPDSETHTLIVKAANFLDLAIIKKPQCLVL